MGKAVGFATVGRVCCLLRVQIKAREIIISRECERRRGMKIELYLHASEIKMLI